MNLIKIVLFLFINSIVYATPILINEKTNHLDILSKSQIYVDKSQKLNINDIQNLHNEFKENKLSLLGFGYDPKINVWVKFTLKNSSDKTINKLIEYSNSLATEIDFFYLSDYKTSIKEGLFNIKKHRKTINPVFNIKLKPGENKTFYIKTTAEITTLIVKLTLFNKDSLYEKELYSQSILSLFFGAMFILAFYNLFIFFFTKDISYFYYVLFIFGTCLHHSIYTGMSNIYFSQEFIIKAIEYSPIIVAIPIYALALFTKSFLQIEHYKKLNILLNIFLVIIPLSLIFFSISEGYEKYRNLLTLVLMFYLVFITIYSAIKKNKQAYYILFGWTIIFFAILFMVLSSAGILNIYKYFPHLIEFSFASEAIIFSIALANRINILQKEKNEADKKLLIQKQNEAKKLAQKVDERTVELKTALDEKDLLMKELHHRVKNNMQTIVSLIRLQNDDVKNIKLHNTLLTIQNRINAMSHLHELLYKQNNFTHINAYEYFEILIEEIRESYDEDINIHFNIKAVLKMEQAIYIGLILNELITNSFKYAFPTNEGNIYIDLEKKEKTFTLIIKDDGVGYEKSRNSSSLGLILIETLTTNQLKGTLNINALKGVTTTIIWQEDE